ncbi:MAG TPA: class I SAM-dependent methyltransferase [Oligoflexia bacterium]|nr:class I SAM-dependent methyltransferase [Oligoflexia bacterium]
MKIITNVLEQPFAYLLIQNVLGGMRARKLCVQDYCEVSPGSNILDIGCGPGYVCQYFPNSNYFGFDPSARYIDYAKKKFGTSAKFFAKEFTPSDLETLPRFDLIMLNGVLHHVDDATAHKILSLSGNALNPGGTIMTIDPIFSPQQSFASKFFTKLDRGKNVRYRNQYEQLARDAGLTVEAHERDDLLFIPTTLFVMKSQKTTDSH